MLFNLLQYTGDFPPPRMIRACSMADVNCASIESPCPKLQAPKTFPYIFLKAGATRSHVVKPLVYFVLCFCVSVFPTIVSLALCRHRWGVGESHSICSLHSLRQKNDNILQCLAPDFVSLLYGASDQFLSSVSAS